MAASAPIWTPLPPREGSGELISRQRFALERPEREIAFVAARGPGKTTALFVFLLRMAIEITENGSNYLYPGYRGLLLRRHSKDLAPTLDDAEKIWCRLGARRIGRTPAVFEWPHGAKIFTDHLENRLAWQQKQGHEYHKIGIEEANQIPTEEEYLLVLGSLRSSPDGNPQVMLTGNWGDIGDIWIKRRFKNVKLPDGSIAAPMQPIRDPVTNHTRIYIPALPEDNPVLMERDPGYVQWLEGLPGPRAAAWRLGDPDAYAGQLFSEFRPNGPLPGDPTWANHVIESAPLPYWLHRWGSMDWGYKHHSAAYKFAQAENGQLHCYSEMLERGRSSFLWGVELAKWWLPELRQMEQPRIQLTLSADTFSTHDEGNTIAERIALGMDAVFGDKSTYLAYPTEEERQMAGNNPRMAAELMQRRASETADRMGINLEPAVSSPKSRSARAEFVHELMRFTPREHAVVFDQAYAQSLLRQLGGESLYADYVKSCEEKQPEVLPRLQIWRSCDKIIELLPILKSDEKMPEAVMKFNATDQDLGDDAWDGFSYGLYAAKNIPAQPPRSDQVASKLREAKQSGVIDPNLLAQIAMYTEKKLAGADDDLRPARAPRLSEWRG